MSVRPAKTQIILGICPVWSKSSLFAWRKVGSLATHLAHSEDSDQTGLMPRLIWVFAGRTITLLVLSCRGLYIKWPLCHCEEAVHAPCCTTTTFESCHAIMVLFVLRKLILQSRMRSHPVGLDVWILLEHFVYFQTLCVRPAQALARLRGYAGSPEPSLVVRPAQALARLRGFAGSPEPSLVAYVISTIIVWAGSFYCSNVLKLFWTCMSFCCRTSHCKLLIMYLFSYATGGWSYCTVLFCSVLRI